MGYLMTVKSQQVGIGPGVAEDLIKRRVSSRPGAPEKSKVWLPVVVQLGGPGW